MSARGRTMCRRPFLSIWANFPSFFGGVNDVSDMASDTSLCLSSSKSAVLIVAACLVVFFED